MAAKIVIIIFFLIFIALIVLAVFSKNRVDEEEPTYTPIVPKEDFID